MIPRIGSRTAEDLLQKGLRKQGLKHSFNYAGSRSNSFKLQKGLRKQGLKLHFHTLSLFRSDRLQKGLRKQGLKTTSANSGALDVQSCKSGLRKQGLKQCLRSAFANRFSKLQKWSTKTRIETMITSQGC